MPPLDLLDHPFAAAMVLLGFIAGGTAKGLFGLGMPFVGMPVMVFAIPFPTALALFLVPNFTANGQQMLAGGNFKRNLKRWFWLYAPMLVIVPFAIQFLVRIDQSRSILGLGLVSFVFAVLQMFPVAARIDPRHERWMNPVVGVVSGLLAGVSGLYGPVLIIYLMALRLPKDDFVASLSLMYFLGSFAIYGSLAFASVIDLEVIVVSALGGIIIGAMLIVGQRLRARIDEARYRKLILVLLMVMGADM
ncbi:MAG: sulfite exporter TauE/SafE family protein, partial [Rhodobacteraceae bacterium]|nr:sulfite exporter TauE/SafE family protein [Paracoccaceae bacterium]